MKCTLICIGVGRASVLDYVSENTFHLSKLALEAQDAVVLDVSEPHSKIVINFTIGESPTDAIKALILTFPHLRFVFYGVDGDTRTTIHGKKGVVTKEGVRDDPPAWLKNNIE